MSCPVVSPRSLDEALRALAGATAATRLLAGGTDLMVELHSGRTRPDRVVDVWALDELRGIREEQGGLRLGALTTCAELLDARPTAAGADVLVVAAAEVGADQIQNRATLGGNLGTASPAADLNPVLVALDATVRLASVAGRRELPVREFLCGYRESLRRHDELIESVWLPPRDPRERRAFRKVGTRRAQSISKVVVSVACTAAEARVAAFAAGAGSVAERTVLLEGAARELVGHAPTPERIERAARIAAMEDCSPIDDVRSTETYRRHVLQRVLRTLLGELLLAPLDA